MSISEQNQVFSLHISINQSVNIVWKIKKRNLSWQNLFQIRQVLHLTLQKLSEINLDLDEIFEIPSQILIEFIIFFQKLLQI